MQEKVEPKQNNAVLNTSNTETGLPPTSPDTANAPKDPVPVDLLKAHYAKQDELANTLAAKAIEITSRYDAHATNLKAGIKAELKNRINQIDGDKKLALVLVDIQNEFVLNGFSLYVAGGENTVFSNMALLNAVAELIAEDINIAKRIEIVTSQDAHVYERADDDADALLMQQAYGEKDMADAVREEKTELSPFDPANKKFGIHCLRGTPGVAIATPIEDCLNKLEAAGVEVNRFGKINFSGPKAGMLLKKGIRLDDPKYRDKSNSIYDDSHTTYLDFFKQKKYDELWVTGIAGDICVKQAAVGLVEVCPNLSVPDFCVHYLIPNPPIKGLSYTEVRDATEAEYKEKKISILTPKNNPAYCSNPNLLFVEGAQEFYKHSKIADTIKLIIDKRDLLVKTSPIQKGNKSEAINNLCKALEASVEALLDVNSCKNVMERKADFKKACEAAIVIAKPKLEEHREHFILNALRKLASAVVWFCTAGSVHRSYKRDMFGLFATNSLQKLEKFQESIDKAFDPAAPTLTKV